MELFGYAMMVLMILATFPAAFLRDPMLEEPQE